MKKIFKLLLFAIFISTLGCSTTKVTGSLAGKEDQSMRMLAVLPIDRPADMPRERVDLIKRAVLNEIQGKGFILVDDSVVSKICGDAECHARGELVKRYGVDGLVALKLNSIARANFLAGYVNTVSGALVLLSPEGEELFRVMHSERERGGILFNSGQVAQAIKSTADNTETDRSFSQLAIRYAKELVAKLPRPTASIAASTQVHARIDASDVKKASGEFDQVCVNGTPQSMAYLVYQKAKSNLREVSSGRYCGLFILEDLSGYQNLSVELRSPYGDIAERKLAIMPPGFCKPTGVLYGNKISLDCDNRALLDRFVIYRSSEDIGPYEKIADVKGNSYADLRASGSKSPMYAVVAVNKAGNRTSPILATAKEH